jgi:hypothetical protein
MDKPTSTTYNPKQPSRTNSHTGSKCRVRSLGRKYGQNAIFSVTDGILSVIGCLSGEKIKVDSWEKRILSDEESKNPNHPFPKKGRNTCLVQEQPQFSLDTTDNLKSLKK